MFNLCGISDSKESACNAGDAGNLGSIPGLGKSPGKGNAYPNQQDTSMEIKNSLKSTKYLSIFLEVLTVN